MKKKNRRKSSAAIIAVSALFMILISLCVYHISTADDASNTLDVSQSINTESEDYATSDIELNVSNDVSNVISDITSEVSEINSKPAEEVILTITDQLDLQLDAPYVAAAYTDGSVIYTNNATAKCYPASLTKLLTVSTAAKYVSNEHIFTVGDELDFVLGGSSIAYLVKGDTLDFLTLVDALLIPSGNDAAYIMAVGVGRAYAKDETLSVNEALSVFLTLMNQTATELGCTDSHFANPDGYHNEQHYTTASDMLKIAIHAYNLDIVQNSVCQTRARHVYSNNTKDITWFNTNRLLSTDEQYYYEYAVGMKTGTTDEAGYCLIAVANKNDKKVITVIMGAATDETRYTDTIAIFNTTYGIS